MVLTVALAGSGRVEELLGYRLIQTAANARACVGVRCGVKMRLRLHVIYRRNPCMSWRG